MNQSCKGFLQTARRFGHIRATRKDMIMPSTGIELPLVGFSVVVEYWGILEVLSIASILKGVKLPANERIRLKKYVADIRKEKPLFDKEEEALL